MTYADLEPLKDGKCSKGKVCGKYCADICPINYMAVSHVPSIYENVKIKDEKYVQFLRDELKEPITRASF